MKKLFSIQGLLVMAVALTMGLTSCSSDGDEKDNTPANEQTVSKQIDPSTIFVSIGAGVAETGTRSEVIYDDKSTPKTYKLRFTEGDRLYVRAEITSASGKIIAGYLDLKSGSIVNSTTSTAKFEGYLTVYETKDEGKTYEKSTHTSFSSDPFSDCSSHEAWLIPNGSDFFEVQKNKTINYLITGTFFASSVEDLMEQNLMVKANSWDKTTKKFSLQAATSQPIVFCTLKGFSSTDNIMVTYLTGDVVDVYTYESRKGYFSPDKDGNLTFAFYGKGGVSKYHAIRLVKKNISNVEYQYIKLGSKSLENKVYTVNKSISSTWNMASAPIVSPAVTMDPGSITSITDGTTISGLSVNYYFSLTGGTVNLSPNSDAPFVVCSSESDAFIKATGGNLTVKLGGDISIFSEKTTGDVFSASGAVKLTTDAATPITLSILVPANDTNWGIKGINNANVNASGVVSGLSDNCTVTLEKEEISYTIEKVTKIYMVYTYTVTKD